MKRTLTIAVILLSSVIEAIRFTFYELFPPDTLYNYNEVRRNGFKKYD